MSPSRCHRATPPAGSIRAAVCGLVVTTLISPVCVPAAAVAGADELQRLDGSTVAVAELERRIPELMAKVWLPGLNVEVLREGTVAYRQSFGVRDAATGAPMTPETSVTGLSFSKTITAYLVMRLADRGVIDLDRPLYAYLPRPLPEYDFYSDLEGDERYRLITARHVLSHTTGWPNWRWFTDEGTLHFLFDPGERHSYSGEGFAYLQLVLEEITGKGFAELARDEVFAPLGMNRSSMVWEGAYAANFAQDHDFLGRPMERERWDEASAAGSLQTTIDDYGRFLLAILDGRGLKPASRDLMLTPQVTIRHARMFGPRLYEATDAYAAKGLCWTLGFGRVDTLYGWAFFHTGNDRGSANYFVAFPAARSAVILTGNSNRLEGIAEDLVELLTADDSSPFDFLGYERWDGPRQSWLRTLADDGLEVGREVWESQGAVRADSGLDEEALRDGAETLARFRSVDEAVALQRWRRELFPASADAVRDLVKLLLAADRPEPALAELDKTMVGGAMAAVPAAELEWFAAWARAVAARAVVPPERLRAFAGEYGPRHFELRGGRLFYGRDATPPEDYSPLFAMDRDTFVLAGVDSFRLRFEMGEGERAARVVGLYEDGGLDGSERTGD
jgi:CubicO group peptidase (beta-lactamase class C family)